MAINSLDVPENKTISKLQTSNVFKKGVKNVSDYCRLFKIDFAAEGSICSASSKHGSKKNVCTKSPYLNSDNVQLLSQVTEKTFFHKTDTGFHSSFPLAANIYKANSDEFRSLKRANKKARKSVLTLPNDQAPIPQSCTVSDMNDSEYFYHGEDRKKVKKRNPVPRNRKFRPKGRDYEFYDRDARYCSQLNISLDCSSTDMINYNGDDKRTGKSKAIVGYKQNEDKPNPHDVWAVLRNINRFQFTPSPPMSEDSFITPKKKKGIKRRNNRKDMRVVETCRTEEFAYISSFTVDDTSSRDISKSPRSISKSSSFDRVTVIDKQDDLNKTCGGIEKKMMKTKHFVRGASKQQYRNLNKALPHYRNRLKANTKTLTQHANKPKALEYDSKKQINYNINCEDSKQNTILNKSRDSPTFDMPKNEPDNPLFEKAIDNRFSDDEEGVVVQEFIYSGNSGSSKAAADSEILHKRVPGRAKLEKEYFDDLNPFNGITKVVLSKGPPTPPPKKCEPPKRKRQGTLSPSLAVGPRSTNSIIPKLTQTEIKRRLAKFKFPIVILGKDQLSSNYEVTKAEPIQFNGLNEQVWPFMVKWQNGEKDKRVNTLKTKSDTLKTKPENTPKKKYSPEVLEYNKTQKINRGFISPRQHNSDKKTTNDSKNKSMNKVEQKRIISPTELQQVLPKKSKPIRQFKDKVLKLLYKNSTAQNRADENRKNSEFSNTITKPACKIISIKVDAGTDAHNIRTIPMDVPRSSVESPVKTTQQVPTTRQPWAKARWASDFIENVISKIKTGVYYTHESRHLTQKHNHERKEAEIQTIATNTENNPIMQSISKITIKKKQQELIKIPGFDNDSLPVLEIQTMNMNEISVKHCVTNIMVHFDITVPNEPIVHLKKSSSLIPLHVTESQTRIFKCKTSIINAMLPAELCSILPKMMWNNIKEYSKALALPSVSVDNSVSQLSTIAEITRCESPEPCKFPLFQYLRMTLELQNLINGCYPIKAVSKCDRIKFHANYCRHLAKELLPQLSRRHLFDCQMKHSSLVIDKQNMHNLSVVKKSLCETQLNLCTTLQTYPASERKLVPAGMHINLMSLQKLSIADKIATCSRVFNYFIDKNITIDLTTINNQGLEDRLSLNIGRLFGTTLENISKGYDKTLNIQYKKELPAIKYNEQKAPSYKNAQSPTVLNNKTKKKGFIRLYRKCKSTSNISTERNSTSLNKITSLDDFFQALGTAKFFSGVFDSIYSHKILSSLKQMKSWVSDINPTQALLVLLLVNKKDTPNLVRFRPVLLQGIAMNRITRANELDMEIEVIEREHLNKLNQNYEGISYLPSSTENQNNLLEEMFWIAKTTASDYQRTFDESSQKLLKSLLQKRKKLNPSYLRVMARYVGLGLLKTPSKK